MFGFNKLTPVQTVDAIEKQVYEFLKPYGFKKFGRTLGRFVDGDIFQLVNFQIFTPETINLQTGERKKGKTQRVAVNLGIRVPECAERCFAPEKNQKYYHDYECNIRKTLENTYSLKKSPTKTAEKIIAELGDVISLFETLCSRQAIFQNREKRIEFDEMHGDLAILDEAMIYGRIGETEKAAALFNEYYRTVTHKGHLEYLESLASKLGIELSK